MKRKQKKTKLLRRGHGGKPKKEDVWLQRQKERAPAQTATMLTCNGCRRSESVPGLGHRRTCVSAWCRSRSCLAASLFGWAGVDYSSPQQAEFLPTSPTMTFYPLAPARRRPHAVLASPRRGGPVQQLVHTPCRVACSCWHVTRNTCSEGKRRGVKRFSRHLAVRSRGWGGDAGTRGACNCFLWRFRYGYPYSEKIGEKTGEKIK